MKTMDLDCFWLSTEKPTFFNFGHTRAVEMRVVIEIAAQRGSDTKAIITEVVDFEGVWSGNKPKKY
jgi:hypothetical protein